MRSLTDLVCEILSALIFSSSDVNRRVFCIVADTLSCPMLGSAGVATRGLLVTAMFVVFYDYVVRFRVSGETLLMVFSLGERGSVATFTGVLCMIFFVRVTGFSSE